MKNPDILIWFGATQTCKSSSIKLLTGDESIVCGDVGKGASTTYDIRIHKQTKHKMSKSFLHIDTIGFGDTRLKVTDADIRNKVEMEILRASQEQNANQIKAIILTESFMGDAEQLSKNLLQITNIFGYLPSKSVIILGTKRDMINIPEMITERQNHIRNVMSNFKIPADHYLPFSTPWKYKKEDDIPQDQYPMLQKIIDRCEPVELQSIRDKQEKIKARALNIQKEQIKTIEQQFQQDRIQFKMEKQAYKEMVPRQKWKGDLGKIFGVKKTVYQQQVRYRDIKVPYTVKEKVKKEIKVEPQYNYCLRLAFQEFQRNTLQQMAKV